MLALDLPPRETADCGTDSEMKRGPVGNWTLAPLEVPGAELGGAGLTVERREFEEVGKEIELDDWLDETPAELGGTVVEEFTGPD